MDMAPALVERIAGCFIEAGEADFVGVARKEPHSLHCYGTLIQAAQHEPFAVFAPLGGAEGEAVAFEGETREVRQFRRHAAPGVASDGKQEVVCRAFDLRDRVFPIPGEEQQRNARFKRTSGLRQRRHVGPAGVARALRDVAPRQFSDGAQQRDCELTGRQEFVLGESVADDAEPVHFAGEAEPSMQWSG